MAEFEDDPVFVLVYECRPNYRGKDMYYRSSANVPNNGYPFDVVDDVAEAALYGIDMAIQVSYSHPVLDKLHLVARVRNLAEIATDKATPED